MSSSNFLAKARQHLAVGTSVFALLANLGAPVSAAAQEPVKRSKTATTPIQHVIVIIGENRTFDHVFATYNPKNGETVSNLLSKRIVKSDPPPVRNFSLATHPPATHSPTARYQLRPT